MERGWLCLWRKIEDSSSWTRGADYRGLMITILQKANWKNGYFMGDKIHYGQFATSAKNLAKDLGLTRQRVQRMLSTLHKDGFITVSNVRNRYTLISLVNWDTYQGIKKQDEQPVSNHWATSEQPVSNYRAQSNKETRKQGNKETNELPEGNSSKLEVSTTVCPHEEIRKLYNKILPELPTCTVRNKTFDKHTRSRWREDVTRQNLEWWADLFNTIKRSDFLMGRTKASFQATLDWIVRPTNMTKILNNNFRNKTQINIDSNATQQQWREQWIEK